MHFRFLVDGRRRALAFAKSSRASHRAVSFLVLQTVRSPQIVVIAPWAEISSTARLINAA